MADNYRNIISAAGEDVEREGIVETPMRAAKAFAFFTKVRHKQTHHPHGWAKKFSAGCELRQGW